VIHPPFRSIRTGCGDNPIAPQSLGGVRRSFPRSLLSDWTLDMRLTASVGDSSKQWSAAATVLERMSSTSHEGQVPYPCTGIDVEAPGRAANRAAVSSRDAVRAARGTDVLRTGSSFESGCSGVASSFDASMLKPRRQHEVVDTRWAAVSSAAVSSAAVSSAAVSSAAVSSAAVSSAAVSSLATPSLAMPVRHGMPSRDEGPVGPVDL
jgi:hypothetical protein